MAYSESRLKSHIPHIPGAIARPRLVAQLEDVVEHKLTLVSAPPGYGKTTAVSQYARETAYPVAWHVVEERERDVPNFYHHALTAIDQIAEEVQPRPEAQGYPPGELAAFVADYIRDLSPQEIVYVLDDVQNIGGSAASEIFLRQLVALLPANCHLVLISRVLPRLPYAEMIARRELLALGQDELGFTADEAFDLAQKMAEPAPTRTRVQDLVKRLEGWPAGVVLALQPLPQELELAMLGGKDGPEALFDTLAGSMLNAQPPDLRDFLLAASTLTRLTPALCSSALGLSNSGTMLGEAQVRNLFLSREAGGLVFHSLFRGFLQRQLRHRDSDRYYMLHSRAGQYFEGQDELDQAFEHYVDSGLMDQAAALADRVAGSYFAQGNVETLFRWHERLTAAEVIAPRLSYMCGRALIDRYEYVTAEQLLAEAETVFSIRSDEIGLADVKLQRAVINLQTGQYQQAVAQAAHLSRVLPDQANLRGRALRIRGMGLVRLGDVEAGTRYLEEALELYRLDGDVSALSHVLQDLNLAYGRLGRLDDAGVCLQEYVALRRSLGGAGALALALNNLGYYYYLRSNYVRARETFQEGLRVIARFSDRRAESYLLWSLGDLERDLSNHDTAFDFYTRALELQSDSEPHLRAAVLVSASTLRRWQGHYHEAQEIAGQAVALARQHNLELETVMARAARLAAKASDDRAQVVLIRLRDFIEELERQGFYTETLGLRGLEAQLAATTGDEQAVHDALDAGLKVAERIGSAQPLVAELAHSKSLRKFIKRYTAQYLTIVEELEKLLEARGVSGQHYQPTPLLALDATYSLAIWTLGQERIDRDGVTLTSADWKATTARDMFLHLLYHGHQTREQISLAFWPDSGPQKVRSNFHTTLYRARHALGDDVILYEGDQYFLNPEINLWWDAREMERLVQQARLLPPRDARAEDMWRRATALYQGDFLPTIDAEWVYVHRERLWELYLESLLGLSDSVRARNDFREALNILRQALELDPYRETIHRAIMICYSQMGEKQRIQSHLDKFAELLHQELATTPSQETLSLATLLLN